MKKSGVSPKSKRQRRDDSVMATNNSSIVSKRSVERLYFPEPHFFRHFVKKPQRRSPLINRGYWLRMIAIENVIRTFLNGPSSKRKVVLNLGCGYDPLAFQWLSKDRSRFQNTTFIDVDYPQLMGRKCEVILNTPNLRDLLDRVEIPPSPSAVCLRSDNYLALGCDLADIQILDSALAGEIDLSSCLILCTAEVSLTYMDVRAADSLIKWAARHDDIRFCLLEQYLPQGAEHPFARKMIQHFENLQTPLKAIHLYPTLSDQEYRFTQGGWLSVTARSLWDLWNDSSFLSSQQRLALNRVEPFDEWEELALFASHYFLLVAVKNTEASSELIKSYVDAPVIPFNQGLAAFPEQSASYSPTSQYEASPKGYCERRYGAMFPISSRVVGYHGGLGTQSRLNSTDLYKLGEATYEIQLLPPRSIEPRMCHTMTTVGIDKCLLVGGRTSPDRALSDCWLRRLAGWERVDDLPMPIYRHSATPVSLNGGEQGVLVYGGKTSKGNVIGGWLLWRESAGWVKIRVAGQDAEPRFGAVLDSASFNNGMLLGGMTEDGMICPDIWEWKIDDTESSPFIHLSNRNSNFTPPVRNAICRLGACLVWSPAGLLLIGGVSSHYLPQALDILCLSKDHGTIDPVPGVIDSTCNGLQPLLIGHSAISSQDSVAIAGGGAVCFSFGTYWNRGILSLNTRNHSHPQVWKLHHEQGQVSGNSQQATNPEVLTEGTPSSLQFLNPNIGISTVRVEQPRDFERVVNNSHPVVIEGLDIGPCTSEWSLEALKLKIGWNTSVVVHEATKEHMDFQAKNFSYVTKPFGTFVDQIAGGSKQYLRSLASERPSERPAELAIDFPKLASDFHLPPELELVARNAHSSPLRISGPVTMWLHYDVMANVLCQIRGTKRMILYPPSDVLYLDIPPGGSSSSINVFDADPAMHPSLHLAHPHDVLLAPGNILFIPPLWLHTASPAEDISVSVNVFFRNLKTGYAAGKDVYGNRDLDAYEKGRRDVERIAKSFEGLPLQMSNFYVERLAAELKDRGLTM